MSTEDKVTHTYKTTQAQGEEFGSKALVLWMVKYHPAAFRHGVPMTLAEAEAEFEKAGRAFFGSLEALGESNP